MRYTPVVRARAPHAQEQLSIGVASSYGKAYIHGAGDPEKIWTADHDSFLESMADAASSVVGYFQARGGAQTGTTGVRLTATSRGARLLLRFCGTVCATQARGGAQDG